MDAPTTKLQHMLQETLVRELPVSESIERQSGTKRLGPVSTATTPTLSTGKHILRICPLRCIIQCCTCRLHLCSVRMRDITFLSTSRQCFISLVCPETVVLSMLFDKNLTVPDIASAVQLENRARPKVANPFNALSLRKQSKEKKVVEKPQQLWEPQMQVGKKVASFPVSHFCLPLEILYIELQVCTGHAESRPCLGDFACTDSPVFPASAASAAPTGRARTCS